MWLAYLFIPVLIAGVALTVAGTGPFGIVVLVIGLGLLGVRLSGRFRRAHGEPTPGDDNVAGPGLGFANPGQKNMTPEQL